MRNEHTETQAAGHIHEKVLVSHSLSSGLLVSVLAPIEEDRDTSKIIIMNRHTYHQNIPLIQLQDVLEVTIDGLNSQIMTRHK